MWQALGNAEGDLGSQAVHSRPSASLLSSRDHKGASQVVLVVRVRLPGQVHIRDAGLIPRAGRSPGGGHSNPLQRSCLENPLDRGAWWVMVHRVTKSQIRLKCHKSDMIWHARTYTGTIRQVTPSHGAVYQSFSNFVRSTCVSH